MTKLHRQSLVGYGEPLCETIIDCPAPRGSEVLVRIERCGVCHSDLHMQDGYFSLGGDKRLDVTKGRPLPFTLGHEIAGVIESCGRSCRRRDARPQGRGLSMDRLRHVCSVPRRRGKSVLRASPSRHRCRRRLRDPRAHSAPALSARLRAAVAVLRRTADVLGADRLCGAQAVRRTRTARTGAAARPRWRRHDGPRAGARDVCHAAARRRHRCRKSATRHSRQALRPPTTRTMPTHAKPS